MYFIDDAENDLGRCLVLKSTWSDDLIDIIRSENISALRLSESMGWYGKELTFLEKLKGLGLRGIEVYAKGVKDLTPLTFLSDLESIGLQCEFTIAPNFSNFKSLKIFKLFWREKAKTIFDCSDLKLLNIVNYPFDTLQDIREMAGLERLQLTSKKLVSLSGVENLHSLKIIDFMSCPKLASLAGVEKCLKLHTIELEACKSINDISCFGELTNLTNLTLADCGKIKSLQPLANCYLLEQLMFFGDTNIEDGELTFILRLPSLKKILFSNRRHYSHKREQITKLLSL